MKRFLAFILLAIPAITAVRAQSAPQATAVYASLSTSLDASSAKPGSLVTAALCDKVKLADGTVLPRNTVLAGSVVAIESNNGTSMSIVLDKADVNGAAIPVHVQIRTLVDSNNFVEGDDIDTRDIKADGMPISKMHGIVLTNADDNSSGKFSVKSKHLWLDYRTLLGCLVSKA